MQICCYLLILSGTKELVGPDDSLGCLYPQSIANGGLPIGFLWFSLHLLFFSDLLARSEAFSGIGLSKLTRTDLLYNCTGHPQIALVVLMGSFQIRAWKQVQNVATNINLVRINSQYWQPIASVWSGMLKKINVHKLPSLTFKFLKISPRLFKTLSNFSPFRNTLHLLQN